MKPDSMLKDNLKQLEEKLLNPEVVHQELS